jgi:hypothetical protein
LPKQNRRFDPQTKAQQDGFTKQFATAIERNDATQMATVFAKDAVLVTSKRTPTRLRGNPELFCGFVQECKQSSIPSHGIQTGVPCSVIGSVIWPLGLACLRDRIRVRVANIGDSKFAITTV